MRIFVPSDTAELASFVNLKDRSTGKPRVLSDEGAVITEKLAKLYDVAPRRYVDASG
ncbi:hypothetical protein ACFTAO_02790 [Paenibacillus rhizoplanae]